MGTSSGTRGEPSAGGGEVQVLSQGSWRVSAERSRIGFKVRKMGLYFVKGRFRRLNGSVEVGTDGAPVRGRLRIDASRVSTRIPPRDWHLRTRDFLAVKPPGDPRRRRAHRAGAERSDGRATLFTVRGHDAQVPLTAHWHHSEGGPALHVSGTVDRTKLGVRPRRPVDWIVGRDVQLDAVLHLEPNR